MNKKELWTRIKNYHFDNLVSPSIWENISAVLGPGNASTKAFANKIMKKHKLPKVFVYRAIEEYKKLKQPKDTLIDFFKKAPKVDLNIKRDPSFDRRVEL